MKLDWNKRAEVSGDAIAERLSNKPRSTKAIEAGLRQFEIDLHTAFVDHDAPDPEALTAIALTIARRRLGLLH
jgi:hypothetical protein